MRDFQYSEEEIMAGLTEISKLEADKRKQFVRHFSVYLLQTGELGI